MNIAALSIRYRTVVMAVTLALIGGGLWAYQSMGRLEDPEFTIKQARIFTAYPGATAWEVAEEVTDEIESAIQRMGQIDRVTSVSEPGLSRVSVHIKDQYTSRALPQVWDELRRRVEEAQRRLPPGAAPSIVMDDFGDVYGILYAVYGDGFSYAELKEHADLLRRELLLVQDVGRVELWGDQQEVVYAEFPRDRVAALEIPPEVFFGALHGQNLASPAGRARVGSQHTRIHPTGQFESVEEIGDLLIRGGGANGTPLYLRDLATIRRGYQDPPTTLMRFNGYPAIGVAISTVAGGNVVRMGEAVDATMRQLLPLTPIGIEIGVVAHEAQAVTQAVNGFLLSLVQAVAIVIAVLMLFMGLRSGVLIGINMLLTVLGTFLLMRVSGILLERISLGALIIALGMLVDNAIVIVDGTLVNLQRGMKRIEAVNAIVRQTMWPLLGATVVAILAFAAIGLSQDRTGEYTRSLFLVILYSLVLSWILAITVTPLLGYWFLPPPPADAKPMDPYGGLLFSLYRGTLEGCLRFRTTTVVLLVAVLIAAVVGFGHVERSFFPPSTRPQFMLHYWLPQGTHIERTTAETGQINDMIRTIDGITDVSTFVGAGAPRLLLTYTPEDQNPAYALILVSVEDHRRIGEIMADVERLVVENFPDSEPMPRQFMLGPGELQKIQVRLRGPDPTVLQRLAEQVKTVYASDPQSVDIMTDWRQRANVIRPVVAEMQARDAGLTRKQIAEAMLYHTDGLQVGVYREGDDLLPIIARPPEGERQTVADVRDAQIWSAVASRRMPLRQVVSAYQTTSEETLVARRNRLPTITVRCDADTEQASTLFARLRPRLEEIDLPDGYSMEWGGEFENSRDARLALAGNIPAVAILMVLTVLALFNSLRPTIIVMLTVPLATIGMTFGLLVTNQPFGFMALLGFMSLSGMLIRNAIVLIDEMRLQISSGKTPYQSIVDAGVSRVRPVALTAFTTVLGLIPLLADRFFVAMAVTIMSGLAFATALTLFVVPLLYALFFRVTPQTPASVPVTTER